MVICNDPVIRAPRISLATTKTRNHRELPVHVAHQARKHGRVFHSGVEDSDGGRSRANVRQFLGGARATANFSLQVLTKARYFWRLSQNRKCVESTSDAEMVIASELSAVNCLAAAVVQLPMNLRRYLNRRYGIVCRIGNPVTEGKVFVFPISVVTQSAIENTNGCHSLIKFPKCGECAYLPPRHRRRELGNGRFVQCLYVPHESLRSLGARLPT
jgi:hypothetical protein